MPRVKWSVDDVVAAIQERHEIGLSLRMKWIYLEDRSLYNAVKSRFRGIRPLLAAMGLAPGPWSPERVLAAIRARHRTGQGLAREAVMASHACLYVAARRFFGSWEAAVRSANLPVGAGESLSDWSPERVVQALQGYRERGVTLGLGELRRRDPALVDAALLHFGSLEKARRVALGGGVAPDELSANQIIRTIRERHRQGLSVAQATVARELPAVWLAARRRFGSWRRALVEAGVAGELKLPRRWTPDMVAAHLRARADRNLPVSGNMVRKQDSGLYRAGMKLFGSWRTALRAAVIDERLIPRSGRKSARRAVSGETAPHHQELGYPSPTS